MAKSRLLLGKRIRALRRAQDLTQDHLSERANISNKYMGEIERGQVNVSVDLVDRIAAALGVEAYDLFDYKHETNNRELKKKINKLVKNVSNKNLQAIYRIAKSILK